MSDRKTGKETGYLSREVNERQHPYKTYLFFAIVGSSILFLSLLFMYVIWLNHNASPEHFQMPKVFIVSTMVMLVSSFCLSGTIKAYRNDEAKKLLLGLSGTMACGIGFSVLQVSGWISLYESGYYINGEPGITLLYILSGLHFLHVGAGIIYLLFLNIKAFDNWNDPVKSLLYFSNKFEGTRIELFSSYWHFVDILWICLFFTFLFTL